MGTAAEANANAQAQNQANMTQAQINAQIADGRAHAEAYRRAAEKLGLQPRELQSITWEGIRSLMGDDKKTPELKSFARDQWDKVQNRELTIKQARENIMEKAGGFTKPDWMTDEQWDEANGTGFNPEEFK